MGSLGTFWLYHSRITRKKRPFPGYLPILPSSPSRVPYHATISTDPITTRTRKSREPEILFFFSFGHGKLLCVYVSL